MPAPYSGNPTGIQSPSPQPVGGGVPIVNIPVAGDRGADFATQALKVAADWIAFLAAQPLTTPSGQLLRTSVLTIASGISLAKWPGTRRARVRMVGGGGCGGGTFFGGSGNGAGSGGAAGGFAEYFTSTVPAAWTFSIGAGGIFLGFASGVGTDGGSTTFSDGLTVVTAFGGGAAGLGLPGLAPALSTNATINGSGEPGGFGDGAGSGKGGSSLMGGAGGPSVTGTVAVAGVDGVGYGAGGSGAWPFGGVSLVIPGNGSAGAIILEEYS